jgi:hypothetical protein
MRYGLAAAALTAAFLLGACARKQDTEAQPKQAAAESPAPAQPSSGPHALVYLKDGSKVPGSIVASSQTDMVVAGDDGIERKIPLTQVKSVEYGGAATSQQASAGSAPAQPPAGNTPAPPPAAAESAQRPAPARSSAPPPPPARVYELSPGSEISVRTNETIDSAQAAEGQTFDAQVTREVRDADGAVVLPRGAEARVVIKSASKGGRFRGASDLVLDLQSVVIHGRSYSIDTVDVSQKGKAGVGANKRTATFTGGGAALGAIIGAIAGGGKGAAIGAGAGAGAGVLTQVLTKGRAIRVPAESVLTFRLDRPLRVTAAQ